MNSWRRVAGRHMNKWPGCKRLVGGMELQDRWLLREDLVGWAEQEYWNHSLFVYSNAHSHSMSVWSAGRPTLVSLTPPLNPDKYHTWLIFKTQFRFGFHRFNELGLGFFHLQMTSQFCKGWQLGLLLTMSTSNEIVQHIIKEIIRLSAPYLDAEFLDEVRLALVDHSTDIVENHRYLGCVYYPLGDFESPEWI